MASLTMTPYIARGPQHIPGGDKMDGFGAEFKVHGIPKGKTYTVFQQIRRVTAWQPDTVQDPSPDYEEFSECWPSRGKSKILDKFMVSRYMRHQTIGSMVVLARAWVVQGNTHDLAAMGYVEGQDGNVNTPWGKTWGQQGNVPPPPLTNVLVRRFKVAWNNVGKTYDDQYRKAADMAPNMDHTEDQVVTK